MSSPSQNVSVEIRSQNGTVNILNFLFELKNWITDANQNCTKQDYLRMFSLLMTVICDKNDQPKDGYDYGQRSSLEVFFACFGEEQDPYQNRPYTDLFATRKGHRGYRWKTDGSCLRDMLLASARDLIFIEDSIPFDAEAKKFFGDALVDDVKSRHSKSDGPTTHFIRVRVYHDTTSQVLKRWNDVLEIFYPELYVLAKQGKLVNYEKDTKLADEAIIKLKTFQRLMNQAKLWWDPNAKQDQKDKADKKTEGDSRNATTASASATAGSTTQNALIAQFAKELSANRLIFENMYAMKERIKAIAVTHGITFPSDSHANFKYFTRLLYKKFTSSLPSFNELKKERDKKASQDIERQIRERAEQINKLKPQSLLPKPQSATIVVDNKNKADPSKKEPNLADISLQITMIKAQLQGLNEAISANQNILSANGNNTKPNAGTKASNAIPSHHLEAIKAELSEYSKEKDQLEWDLKRLQLKLPPPTQNPTPISAPVVTPVPTPLVAPVPILPSYNAVPAPVVPNSLALAAAASSSAAPSKSIV